MGKNKKEKPKVKKKPSLSHSVCGNRINFDTHVFRANKALEDMVNEFKAKIYMAPNETERLKVAQELLWQFLGIIIQLPTVTAKFSMATIADSLWREFTVDYHICIKGSEEWGPTELWVRQLLTHTIAKSSASVVLDPAFIRSYQVRGWGHPVPLLYPDRRDLPANERCVIIPIPTILVECDGASKVLDQITQRSSVNASNNNS